MSLDVYLITRDVDGNELSVYQANITHNLGTMADEAGIYYALWRPEERDWMTAREITPTLAEGLEKLKANPEHYQTFDAPNGWGLYVDFVPWLERYLAACQKYPSAVIEVSR